TSTASPGESLAHFMWSQTAGPEVLVFSDAPSVTEAPTSPGTYQVSLSVADTTGTSSSPASVMFVVGPSAAGASAGGASDAGTPDGGGSDGGMPDSGLSDAGMPDSGRPDGGQLDGGAPDARTLSVGCGCSQGGEALVSLLMAAVCARRLGRRRR